LFCTHASPTGLGTAKLTGLVADLCTDAKYWVVVVSFCSVAAVNSFVARQANASAAADISAAWSIFCSSTLQRNSTLCAKVADSITRSHAGNFGKRAGAICLGLGGKALTSDSFSSLFLCK
jgi:hypothetical protein